MKVGDEVALTVRGEAEIEAAARHISELLFGRVLPYAVPMISAGERGTVTKDAGDGLFECRFAYGTVLCNEAMVEAGAEEAV
jgi:hypothetical protein